MANREQANAGDPQIPAALFPVASGILSLHNFPRNPLRHTVGAFTRTSDGRVEPQFTGSTGQFFVVGPADFAKIYNVTPSGLDGTGRLSLLSATPTSTRTTLIAFRTLFGLSANFNASNIIVNGPDPGISGSKRRRR